MLKTFQDNYFHAVITDPPAGIAFMGKEWDKDKGGRDTWIAWLTEIATECLRVIKPGGHAFVWALPRTSHWTGMAWENAGWEPRDKICHVFGQGFPKSLDISKALDRDNKAEREVIGKGIYSARGRTAHKITNSMGAYSSSDADVITAPSSPEAIQWSGYGTALKPSHEDWWLFRKPLDGRVIDSIRTWGCGGINVDASRIPGVWSTWRRLDGSINKGTDGNIYGHYDIDGRECKEHPAGRFPANLILSHSPNCVKVGRKKIKSNCRPNCYGNEYIRTEKECQVIPGTPYVAPEYADASGHEEIDDYVCSEDCPVRLMGEQSGISKSTNQTRHNKNSDNHEKYNCFGKYGNNETHGYSDLGTAARFFLNIEPEPFFYCPKASSSERNFGLDNFESSKCGVGALRDSGRGKVAKNVHPTVKPLKLMRYLCRLITPPGGLILDPFAGSGTTLCAAKLEGFEATGIELNQEYITIAEARLAAYKPDPQTAFQS